MATTTINRSAVVGICDASLAVYPVRCFSCGRVLPHELFRREVARNTTALFAAARCALLPSPPRQQQEDGLAYLRCLSRRQSGRLKRFRRVSDGDVDVGEVKSAPAPPPGPPASRGGTGALPPHHAMCSRFESLASTKAFADLKISDCPQCRVQLAQSVHKLDIMRGRASMKTAQRNTTWFQNDGRNSPRTLTCR